MLKVCNSSKLFPILVGIFSIPFAILMGGGLATAEESSVNYNVNVAPSLNIALSGDIQTSGGNNNVVLNLNPNNHTYDSKNVNVVVATNNITGYKLTMTSTGNTTDLVRNSTIDGINATIPTLTQ